MPRYATIPADPTGLASLVAALRSATKGKEENDFDRFIRASLARDGVDGAILEKLLGNFTSNKREIRQRVLGDLDDVSYVPSRLNAHDALRPSRRGTTAMLDAAGQTLSVGPTEAAEDPNAPRAPRVNWYRIQYNGFHCDAERGDAGWSDEVYLVTTAAQVAADGTNSVDAMTHPQGSSEYSNVDVGDTRLGPVATCWQGLPPMSLTAVAFEHDYGDPNYYKDEIRVGVYIALWVAAWKTGYIDSLTELDSLHRVGILTGAAELITNGINWLIDTDDDQTDIPRTVVLDLAAFERFGRRNRPRRKRHIHEWNVPFSGDVIEEETDLFYDIRTRHSGGGGRYAFGYLVDRDPPFPPRNPDVD